MYVRVMTTSTSIYSCDADDDCCSGLCHQGTCAYREEHDKAFLERVAKDEVDEPVVPR